MEARGGGGSLLKLGHRDSPSTLGLLVCVIPDGCFELWTLHRDLGGLDTAVCLDILNNDMDPGAEAEHQASILSIEDQIASSKQDLAWS